MKKIILDHDLGSDCDDAAAAAIAIKSHKNGTCKVLAITQSIGSHYGSYAIQALCEYFDVSDIPIGINVESDLNDDDGFATCTKFTTEKYFKGRVLPRLEGNTRLLRKILAENGKKDITFVTTGPLTTVSELFKTRADDISEKSGLQLFKENVVEFVCGVGNVHDPNNREWNIRADPTSAIDEIGRAHV